MIDIGNLVSQRDWMMSDYEEIQLFTLEVKSRIKYLEEDEIGRETLGMGEGMCGLLNAYHNAMKELPLMLSALELILRREDKWK